jgi:hypothetical protein
MVNKITYNKIFFKFFVKSWKNKEYGKYKNAWFIIETNFVILKNHMNKIVSFERYY